MPDVPLRKRNRNVCNEMHCRLDVQPPVGHGRQQTDDPVPGQRPAHFNRRGHHGAQGFKSYALGDAMNCLHMHRQGTGAKAGLVSGITKASRLKPDA